MQPRTIAVVILLASLFVAGGVAFVLATGTGADHPLTTGWESEERTAIGGHHHGPAVAAGSDEPLVVAPFTGEAGSDDCRLVAMDGDDGETLWSHDVAPADCSHHGVSYVAVDDATGDGDDEVLAVTGDGVLRVWALDGTELWTADVGGHVMPAPRVADLDGEGPQVLVATGMGELHAFESDGSHRYTTTFDGNVHAELQAVDAEGDGTDEVVVGSFGGDEPGTLTLFDGDGEALAERSLEGSLWWLDATDHDGETYVAAGATDGTIAVLDERLEERWTDRPATYAAVSFHEHDGELTLYAGSRDGVLRTYDATDGEPGWETTVTGASVQMMPPAAVGDVTGDGEPEVIAVAQDGTVAALDADGEGLGAFTADSSLYLPATLADTTGDGVDEVVVQYGDGRVVLYEAR